MKNTFVYGLEDLDCAVCAGEMEEAVRKIPGVLSADVSYFNQTLTIECDESDISRIMKRAVKVCRRIEPDCKIDGGTADRGKILDIVRIVFSSVLLLAAHIYGTRGLLGGYLCIISCLAAGYEVIWKALRNIIHGRIFDENFLMTVASVGAIIIGKPGEAAAVMIFYSLGELLEDIAAGKSRRSISALLNIRPDKANVLRGGDIISVLVETVEVGETILVRAGEKIPIDGVIIEGNSSVDTSSVSGESIPRDVTENDRVFSGSINCSGTLKIRTECRSEDSTAAKIIGMVRQAQTKKARTESFISNFARYYTPAVCAFSLLVAVVPVLLGGNLSEWIYRALLCLVVSCPCALVVSVPLSFFGAIGSAAKHGVLFRGSSVIENLSKSDTVVFDKTGTLTTGKFTVTDIRPSGGADRSTLLEYAAAAESASSHPIALSITEAYGGELSAELISAENRVELAGMGISAVYRGVNILAGNLRLMEKYGIEAEENSCAGTSVYIAADGKYMGSLIISDTLRPNAKDALDSLSRVGIRKKVMLTGDGEITAKAMAAESGINEVHHSLLPQDKVNELEKIMERASGKVIYVGDGINDAPVLARADVGAAMGAMGSDIAIETADAVIMDDDISKLSSAIDISRFSVRIAKENIIIAIGTKAAIILLASLGIANMWAAVFADVGVLILAVLNAMRTLSK